MEQVQVMEDRVKDFIVDQFLQGDGRDLTDTLDLVETRVLTSINVLRLVDFLEEGFGITLKPDDIFHLTSIVNIARITRLRGAA